MVSNMVFCLLFVKLGKFSSIIFMRHRLRVKLYVAPAPTLKGKIKKRLQLVNICVFLNIKFGTAVAKLNCVAAPAQPK
jgi:hypothetical protein